MDELDSATTTTRHFDNRASWLSLDSTSASYQEALPSCTGPGQLTRTRPPFEPVRPREGIENRQLRFLR
ncbi:D-alanine--D-alanine ligase [Streptomyces sp. GKU 895]|nr:D-alanine--D-alanine ligase [Streptomyces sp. GKU 895]